MKTVPRLFQSSVMVRTGFTLKLPTDVHPELKPVVQEFEELFSKQLGKTNVTKHSIDTGEVTPIKLPPRQIPFHYAD